MRSTPCVAVESPRNEPAESRALAVRSPALRRDHAWRDDVLGACDGDGPSNPAKSLPATYALTQVNGQALPASYAATSNLTQTFTSGSLTLRPEGRYVETLRGSFSAGGRTTAFVEVDSGSWRATGTAVVFRSGNAFSRDLDAFGVSGAVTYTVGGVTYSFRR